MQYRQARDGILALPTTCHYIWIYTFTWPFHMFIVTLYHRVPETTRALV